MEEDCDRMVKVVSSDNIEFTGRKKDLIEKSDYFKALFNSGMKDSCSSKIKLPCIDSEGLRFAFSFLCNKKKDSLSMDIIYNVLNAASYLQIHQLTLLCTNFLKENLTLENYIAIKELADDFQLDQSRCFVDAYICENFEEIVQGENFFAMSRDWLLLLLNNDMMNVKSEVTLFRAALHWVRAKNELSSDSVNDILSGVRFPLMTNSDLEECKTCLSSLGLDNNLEVFKRIELAQDHVKNPTLLFEHINNRTYFARNTSRVLLALGGFTHSDHTTNRIMIVSTDDLLKDEEVTWKFHPPSKNCLKLPKALCEHCVACVGVFLFVAGGQSQYCQDGRHTQHNVYRLDTRNGIWSEVSPMKVPRSLFYMGVLDGKIYVVGGWKGPDSVSKCVERYHIKEDKWEQLALLDFGLHEHAGTPHEGKLFVSGGFKGPYRGHLNRVWCYSPALDQWEEKASMIHARSYHSMVSTGSHLLVAGGVKYLGNDIFEDVLDCEQFSSATNQWTIITTIPRYASCMSSCLLENSLYIFGGHSFALDAEHQVIQIYDVISGIWTQKKMHSKNVKFFASAVTNMPRKILDSFKLT